VAVQIIVTPQSGEGRALGTARRLERALAEAGYDASIRVFRQLGALLDWAASCDPEFAYLVCAGGDSTQSVAAGAAMRLGVPLVPVPNGFGNMFAAAFGHRRSPESVLALLERGETCRVDVGRAGSDLFLSHRSYGPLEEIEKAVEHGREHLRIRSLRALAYCGMAARYLLEAPLPAIRVEVDGRLVARAAAMVTVANVETYRGYLSLTPGASPADGLLDICVIPRTTKLRLFRTLVDLWRERPGCRDRIALCRGRRVRIAVDGGPPEDIRLLPSALAVLVPAGGGTCLSPDEQDRTRALSPPSGTRERSRLDRRAAWLRARADRARSTRSVARGARD
jgi:diacylglycerol kinase (ATP)